MNILTLAQQAATLKNWAVTQEPNGNVKIQVDLPGGRKQNVIIHSSKDGDGDTICFIWSKAAEINNPTFDAVKLLRFNLQLIYGRVALNGNDVLIIHALYDKEAQLAEVGKTLYWVARAADDLEKSNYGAYQDQL
jgi:hypothetical protein